MAKKETTPIAEVMVKLKNALEFADAVNARVDAHFEKATHLWQETPNYCPPRSPKPKS